MKAVKNFILVEILLVILKIVGGLVSHSNAMLASSLLEIVLLIISLFVIKQNDNKKIKGIVSSVLGFIIILSGIGMIYYTLVSKFEKVSWLILLFVILVVIARYLVGCFYANINFKKKNGILGYSNVNSNTDFYMAGIMILVLILSKVSKWVEVLKYADKVGAVVVSLFVVYKGIKLIINSFKYLEDKEIILDSYAEEISNRSEVKKVVSINMNAFGGIRRAKCNLVLNSSVTMLDLSTFVVTLQDYLLKVADVVEVNLVEESKIKPRKPKVRSLKQDARNSGSRNSKTNTKKKNTKKKNKKR